MRSCSTTSIIAFTIRVYGVGETNGFQIADFRLKIFQFAICNLKFEMGQDGRKEV
jgi:hypothetical protein